MSAPTEVVFFADGSGVFLRTSDPDLTPCSSMLDETDMPDPPGEGVFAWVDRGSRPSPPGLDSMYSEGVDWRGAWRRLDGPELVALCGCELGETTP